MKDKSKKELRSSLDDLLGYDLPDEVEGLDEDHQLPKVKAESNQKQGISLARNKARE